MDILDSESENENENTPIMLTPVIIPNDEPQANKTICYAALADKQQGTLYTDATGAFTEMSLDGKQLFFAYDYDTNFIFALPIANVQDKTIIEAFDKVFTELTGKGHKPTFNVTDNQAVTPLKKYLCSKKLQVAICRTSQPPCQCSRTCHPNVQKPLHRWFVIH